MNSATKCNMQCELYDSVNLSKQECKSCTRKLPSALLIQFNINIDISALVKYKVLSTILLQKISFVTCIIMCYNMLL